MAILVQNLILAIAFGALMGDWSWGHLSFGFLLGYIILKFTHRDEEGPRYFSKLWSLLELSVFFFKELFSASFRVAYDVVTPTHHMKPAIIQYPLKAESGLEITLLANLISLTPGTLSLDVRPNQKLLFIHTMYLTKPEDLIKEIAEGFERRVIKLLR
ncbi:MAG: Na+/H+ antiporter subunit E [Deltaproteobacteria bacterium]|nr:Na+/H+ antiporter subunit E [Deltaproteobacteria bacterium]